MVICPDQTVQQWADEMKKCIREEKKIVLIKSSMDFAKYSYADLQAASFVMVSFSALRVDIETRKDVIT